MTCSYCATELPAGAMFCGECGRPVSARPASPVRVVASRAAPIDELVSPVVIARVTVPDEQVVDDVVVESPVVDGPVVDEPEVAAAVYAPEPAVAPIPPLPRPGTSLDAVIEEVIVDAESRGAGWCAQCGALMSAADIFCGECGFVRSPANRSRDTVALDPFPWGAGTAPFAPHEPPTPARDAPAVAYVQPVDVPEDDDDIDATRIVAPGARGDRFVLQFSTGESVTVTGAGLLGRNPMPEPGEFFDAMVTISDPGKSVSKTHLEFGQEGGAFWVSDRYSGNGTVVREPERPARRCEPGKRYRIVRGTRVDIGEQFFVVS